LFEIEIKEGLASDSVEPAKSESRTVEEPGKAAAPLISTNMKIQPASHTRTPLIKFLGPRKLLWKPASSPTFVTTEAQPKTVTIANGTMLVQYESTDQLPKKYQPIPFSDLEMQAIDVFITYLGWQC
jgi:hypothetical protein